MKFRFALAAVLRVRHIREDQQHTCCWPQMSSANRIRRQLAAVEQDQSQRRTMVSEQIATGIWGAELQFDSDCQRQSKILRERILLQLQEATKRAGQEREKYLSLRRDRPCHGNAARQRPAAISKAKSEEESNLGWMKFTCCPADERNRVCLATRQHLPGSRGAATSIPSARVGVGLNSTVFADS